jgi:hypothetical protein
MKVTVFWNAAWYKCIDVQGYLEPPASGSMGLSAVSLKRRCSQNGGSCYRLRVPETNVLWITWNREGESNRRSKMFM